MMDVVVGSCGYAVPMLIPLSNRFMVDMDYYHIKGRFTLARFKLGAACFCSLLQTCLLFNLGRNFTGLGALPCPC